MPELGVGLLTDQEPGVYEARWDGTDERGRQVPSGVYFYGPASADRAGARRLVLVR